MACLTNVLPVFILILLRVVKGQQGAYVQANDNAEQFALFCRIYNVAKNPPINHVDLKDPSEIVKDIDALNASFAEDKQFNESEQMGNSSDVQVKPTTRETAVAQAILRLITRKAHNILKEIKQLNATRDIGKVVTEFSQVIFGEGMNESHLCDGVLNGVKDRATACGKPGTGTKGDRAGKNLVVDSLCLCAQNTEDGIYDACKVKVGSKSDKHSWGKSPPSGSSSMWASIKKECGNLLHKAPKSTKEGHEVLQDFLMHLKSGGFYRWGDNSKVDGSNRKEGMLGTGMVKKGSGGTDLVCDGKKGNGKGQTPGGICVYYGQESDWQSIPWLKRLKNALSMVNTVNNQTTTIQRSIEKLNMLLHRAEQIYETTKVISEIENPVAQVNFHTAAKRLTAYNAAKRYHPNTHFILLFVL